MADLPPAAIVEVYFDPRCAPCRGELPVLADAVRDGLALNIVILGGEEAKARQILAEVSPMLPDRARSANARDPRGVLRDAGNGEGILPYARSVKPDGTTCGAWRGVLSLKRLRALLAACT